MDFKIIHSFVFLATIAMSSERRIPKKQNDKILQKKDNERLISALIEPSTDHSLSHHEAAPRLFNIQTLNLYLNSPSSSHDDGTTSLNMDNNRENKIIHHNLHSSNLKLLNDLGNQVSLVDKFNNKDNLRCPDSCTQLARGGCGCSRPYIVTPIDKSEDEDRTLRCVGNHCENSISKTDLRDLLQRYILKYNIDDDLDALVIDLTRDNDFERLNDVNKNDNNKKFQPLKIYAQNRENEQPKLKVSYQKMLNRAENFVKNLRGEKDILNLSNNQKLQLQKLRAKVQNDGAETDNEMLRDRIEKILKTMTKYSKSDLRRNPSKSANRLSLTKQQTMKNNNRVLLRRNLQKTTEEYGVPFELHVEGLGQLNQSQIQ
ncbi:hypothetical protein ACJJTC_005142 [Scirpophaga incertulas]